ncbi:adenosylcobinamide kinase/adenosylcobinamide-phosphate guanylyltransferase [Bacillus pakistanensis]|uniref:Adenosylcobinamide kinase n=1 Tax=Rossellomorea pakistanensis TaxID=992288 RepID=A0ABS2N7K0_9BACI|nr:bifunctional adenosylcobinamide kinase/adenosylcobinamide-phosphate guanylyltransferase [Bacillus pakistanensis]MBM7583837.1 adenosylcobinamide kinase/adenosylcobinamide-phosphate guanylyltransferase [Bacillus pakistanensis]
METNNTLLFITGGVRSGKSGFAEQLAKKISISTATKLHYLATAQSTDTEMKNRILRHKLDRQHSDVDWTTWECPINIQNLSYQFSKNDTVLLDCLTTLLTNEMFSSERNWNDPIVQDDIIMKIHNALNGLKKNVHTLLVVSNEVLNEPGYNNELITIYQRMIGILHQKIVLEASQAYLIESGIPVRMKGESL